MKKPEWFSEGPWALCREAKNSRWRGDGTEVVGPHGERICDADGGWHYDLRQPRANATLIAAAPDLAEALHSFLAAYNNDEKIPELAYKHAQAAKAALLKAGYSEE